MPTYFDKRLKPCRTCGTAPALEHWASGGPVYAVRCNNPHRPDTCSDAFCFSKTSNPEETIARWNFYQSAPWRHDRITLDWLDRRKDDLQEIESAPVALLAEACTYCQSWDNPFSAEIARRAGNILEYERASDAAEKGKIVRAAALSFGIRVF